MNPKKFITLALLVLAADFSKVKAQTVFVTETGKKYHTKNCSLLKEGKKKAISLKEAKEKNYEPCKPCKADEIVLTDDKKKQVKSKTNG